MNERLRILVLTANPVNMPQLKLRDEHRLLRSKMRDNAEVGNCEILVETAARLTEVERALKTELPHIVHFAGHGTDDCICLEDDNGASLPLSKEQLSKLFNLAAGHLRVVVLNACYSASQIEGLRQLVDYVIGTTSPVADDAALCFAADFYHGLAVGDSVREAFHQAQGKLAHLGEKTQADLYQLHVRPDVDETKPLLPPFADDQITVDVAKEISAQDIDVANILREGRDAFSSPAGQRPNERKKLDLRAGSMKAKGKLNFANEIIRTSE
jgi:CHAT domain-containing protein